MKTLAAALTLFLAGAVSGGASIHTVYTSTATTHIQNQGDPVYSDADRRGFKRLIQSELRRARK